MKLEKNVMCLVICKYFFSNKDYWNHECLTTNRY